jgi:exonuclease VII small subunit
MLVELARNRDERMDQHDTWINQLGASQARVETNLAALTEIVSDLGRAQARTEQALVSLAEAQTHTDQRLDALIEVVEQIRDGNP